MLHKIRQQMVSENIRHSNRYSNDKYKIKICNINMRYDRIHQVIEQDSFGIIHNYNVVNVNVYKNKYKYEYIHK